MSKKKKPVYEENYYEDDNIDEEYQFEDDDLEQIDISYEESSRDYSEYDVDSESPEDDEEDSGRANFFHIAFLVITGIIVITVTILLVNWHKGTKLEISDENRAGFESESEDFYVDFSPYDNPDYVDDGEMNVVLLGDDLLLDCDDETSIANKIAKKANANVTTFALPGVTCATRSSDYDSSYPEDRFSFFYVANCIANQDYSPLYEAIKDIDEPDIYYDFWERIHNYDFSKVDVFVICYGSNDFLYNYPMSDENPYRNYGVNLGTAGALDMGLEVLRKVYPNTQFITSSPSFFLRDDGNGNLVGADLSGYGNEYGNLGGYVVYELNASLINSVTFLDNYFGLEYNSSNYEGYLNEDGRYPNEKGRQVLADHITENFYYLKDKSVIAQ